MQTKIIKSKRPRLQSKSLPTHTETINQRLSKVYRELGVPTAYVNKKVVPVLSDDNRMDMIRKEMNKAVA
jgi:hypothetical protein